MVNHIIQMIRIQDQKSFIRQLEKEIDGSLAPLQRLLDACDTLADYQILAKQPRAAKQTCAKILAIISQIEKINEDKATRYLSSYYITLGDICISTKDYTEALDYYQNTLAISISCYLNHTLALGIYDLLWAFSRMAYILRLTKDPTAKIWVNREVGICEALCEKHPDNLLDYHYLAGAYLHMAKQNVSEREYTLAKTWCEKANQVICPYYGTYNALIFDDIKRSVEHILHEINRLVT